jgi:hypothetical protein
MRPVARICAGVAILGFVGCAGFPIYNVQYEDNYRAGETKVLPKLPVVVRGNPFPVPQAQFDGAVVDGMQGWSGSSDVFTATGDPNSPYRVMIVFNPVSSNYSYTSGICDRPIKTEGAFGAAPSAKVPMAAAVCRGDSWLSYLSGSIETVGGPDGGYFRSAIQQATLLLLPVQNPTANGNNSRDCKNC